MMQSFDTANRPPDRQPRHWAAVLRSWIGNRWVLLVGGLAVVFSGLALGWNWLSAVGVAPLIVSTAPCLLMCAVGVCAMCRSNPGGSTPATTPNDAS